MCAKKLIIADLLSYGKEQLGLITDLAGLEAEVLLAHLLIQPRTFLHAWPEKEVDPALADIFLQLVTRRLQGEPMAYLTGKREFWSLELQVTKDTLIPRPETELVVETVLKLGDANAPLKIADLGTGSGAIAIALAKERPNWHIVATDISGKALALAGKNAQRFGLNNISFHLGSWCTALPQKELDMIVSNPPYIAENEWAVYANGLAYEPRLALVAGSDGLAAYREISETALSYLKPNAYVVLEHGYSQGRAVAELLTLAGFCTVSLLYDEAGHERVTVASTPLGTLQKLDYN